MATSIDDEINKMCVLRMILMRGENCEDIVRKAMGEGEGSLKEKFR